MDELKTCWRALAAHYTKDEALIDQLWQEIVQCYTAAGRYYHTLHHVGYMLGKACEHQDKLSDRDTLLFSVFYHDIVYDPQRQDNEERSAVMAQDRLQQLGMPTGKIAKCREQIRATKSHQAGSESDTNYLLDFDLAVLGESPEVYQDYAQNIRREYALYPDAVYRQGRKSVLEHFLTRDRIFKTEEFRKQYEASARENLRAELAAL